MTDADPILARLAAAGLALPANCRPSASYIPWRRVGNLVILAGQTNEWEGALPAAGLVGRDISTEDARLQARNCALNLLFCLREACGGRLDRVRQWVRLGGFVAAEPGFPDAPLVVNGTSQLLIDLYGDAGLHARTAIAVAGLPGGACVEVDAMVEIAD